jgi:hypothetical protein
MRTCVALQRLILVPATEACCDAWVQMTSGSAKRKFAVLGGGISALSAVFDLTSEPDWQDRYDITVHQLSWRLGGKGASSRNADRHQRIEGHGLRIWLGFYENAFEIMRRSPLTVAIHFLMTVLYVLLERSGRLISWLRPTVTNRGEGIACSCSSLALMDWVGA